MNNNQEFPIPVKGQYALWQIIGICLAGGAPMGDEADLAIVLGHEIGHVTARHGASQYSRSTLAGLGLGIGSVLSTKVAQVSTLAEAALGLLFLKYGRDDETQSDELGVQYATRAGWDPQRGVDFFEVLDRQQQDSGQSLPTWLSTHPAPADRVVRTRQLAANAPTASTLRSGEASHKGHIEGLVFGDNPRQGFFDGSTFKHPDEPFLLRFPAGWETRNTPAAVLDVEPKQQARLQLTVADAAGQSPQAYLRALATSAGAEILGVRDETIGGRAAALAEFRLTDAKGPTILQLAAIQRPQSPTVFQIVGVAATAFPSWRFGILGCGNIGQFVIRNLARPEFKQLSLQVLADVPTKEVLLKDLAAAHRCAYTVDPDTLIDRQLQLVMEAATPEVVKRHVPKLLRPGIHVLAMSVGALADEEMLAEAARAAEAGASRLLLPTGAIAGLDYLRAAQLVGLEEASITITKSPKSLAGAPHFQQNPVDLFALREPTAVFVGSAREAIASFPANVNVAVAVSLASVGVDKTRVRVICDPAATQTRFSIRARGATGEMQIELVSQLEEGETMFSELVPPGESRLFKDSTNL